MLSVYTVNPAVDKLTVSRTIHQAYRRRGRRTGNAEPYTRVTTTSARPTKTRAANALRRHALPPRSPPRMRQPPSRSHRQLALRRMPPQYVIYAPRRIAVSTNLPQHSSCRDRLVGTAAVPDRHTVPARHTAAPYRHLAAAVATQDRPGAAAAGSARLRQLPPPTPGARCGAPR